MAGELSPASSSPQLVLASASPRRLELLGRLGIKPAQVVATDIDESPLRGERPRAHAVRLAAEKARAASRFAPDAIILAGDTVVGAGARILPKAEDEATARECLTLLSGRRHRVFSAIAVLTPDGRMREALSETIVRFKRLSEQELEDYLAAGEWRGKAGGYAIQGSAEGFCDWLSGSHSGVIGLPLFETRRLVRAAGLDVR
ncbi:MAG: nucleoside triphosphate pyrophosphatase [Novosphingobium sp.]